MIWRTVWSLRPFHKHIRLLFGTFQDSLYFKNCVDCDAKSFNTDMLRVTSNSPRFHIHALFSFIPVFFSGIVNVLFFTFTLWLKASSLHKFGSQYQTGRDVLICPPVFILSYGPSNWYRSYKNAMLTSTCSLWKPTKNCHQNHFPHQQTYSSLKLESKDSNILSSTNSPNLLHYY